MPSLLGIAVQARPDLHAFVSVRRGRVEARLVYVNVLFDGRVLVLLWPCMSDENNSAA